MVDCKTGPSKGLLCNYKDTLIDDVMEADAEMIDDLKKDPTYIPENDQQKDEQDQSLDRRGCHEPIKLGEQLWFPTARGHGASKIGTCAAFEQQN